MNTVGNASYSGRKEISKLQRQETSRDDENVHCLDDFMCIHIRISQIVHFNYGQVIVYQ